MNAVTATQLSMKDENVISEILAAQQRKTDWLWPWHVESNGLRVPALMLGLAAERAALGMLWRLEGLARMAGTSVGKRASASAEKLMDFVARNVVTLDIEDSDVRFMVVKRGKVRSWGSAPLEPGVVKDGMVQNAEALTGALRELITSGRLK